MLNEEKALVVHNPKEKKSEGTAAMKDDSDDDNLDKQPLLKRFKIMTPIPNSIPLNTFVLGNLLKPKEQQKSLHKFTDQLFGTTSSKFSPTPPRETTPPRDPAKDKEVAIVKEQVNELVTYRGEGGSVPKMPKLKSFITLEGTLSQEDFNNQIKELKRISDLCPLPITKISYIVHSNKEETMKIITGDNPLNLIVHPNFRLKSLGFSEWLEVHALAAKKTGKSNDMLLQSLRAKFQWVMDQAKKLGLPSPLALATFRMTAEEKKRKRREFLKEAFVTEDIRVDRMNMELIPPPKVVPIEGLVIKEPESGIFYMNGNMDIVFQRESEFHLTPTVQLIRIQNQIKVDSEIADEMFRKMIYVIEARSDCIKARETVEKDLDNLG
ncbi:hypothetical protein Tco_0556657 [Tanacetum coccineum]